MPMSDKVRRRLAQSGEQQIQGAILSLLEQHPDGLKLGKIAAVLQLTGQGYDAIVSGRLKELRKRGLVHQPRGPRMAWAIQD